MFSHLNVGIAAFARAYVRQPFDGRPATAGIGQMTALVAADRPTVDRYHAKALAHGGSDEGRPGVRPDDRADHDGAYFRDPDGNKLRVVCHHPAGGRADIGRA